MDEWEEPPPEAYERVTNPERFAAVVEAARDLVDRLEATYDVRREVGSPDEDFPRHWRIDGVEVVRLVSVREGAGSLALGYTDFPGVLVRMGRAHIEAYPSCGCDACNEDPADLIEQLTGTVDAYVGGGLTETVSRRAYEYDLGHATGWTRLERGERRDHGPLGTTRWAAWPERPRSGT